MLISIHLIKRYVNNYSTGTGAGSGPGEWS